MNKEKKFEYEKCRAPKSADITGDNVATFVNTNNTEDGTVPWLFNSSDFIGDADFSDMPSLFDALREVSFNVSEMALALDIAKEEDVDIKLVACYYSSNKMKDYYVVNCGYVRNTYAGRHIDIRATHDRRSPLAHQKIGIPTYFVSSREHIPSDIKVLLPRVLEVIELFTQLLDINNTYTPLSARATTLFASTTPEEEVMAINYFISSAVSDNDFKYCIKRIFGRILSACCEADPTYITRFGAKHKDYASCDSFAYMKVVMEMEIDTICTRRAEKLATMKREEKQIEYILRFANIIVKNNFS